MMNTDKSGTTILFAEDDAEVRNYLELALRGQGYNIEIADNGQEALDILEAMPHIGAVLLDVVMPRLDGLETLKEIRKRNATVPVIMLSGEASPLNIVEAMRNGAVDFLLKPVSPSDLRKALRSALGPKPAPVQESLESSAPSNPNIFFGQSTAMRELQQLIPQIAWSEAPALILAETGAGKEVLARELHNRSPRARKPFLKVNCAALPSELVESELFGYERGAFTGAFQKKPGLFELAHEGTIFLDEIGDMDFKLQAKLLQVLQDQEFQRLGGRETVRVDVRIIAATHKDLDKAIAENTFRSDLYYRLNVINLRVPPLRQRKDDLPALTDFLLLKHLPSNDLTLLTPQLRDVMAQYDWPGNIRELENIIRKLIVFRNPDLIVKELRVRAARQFGYEKLQAGLSPSAGEPTALKRTILEQVTCAKNEAESTAIIAALESTQWNRKKAAAVLKLDYKALLYKMKKLRIDDRTVTLPPSARSEESAAAASA